MQNIIFSTLTRLIPTKLHRCVTDDMHNTGYTFYNYSVETKRLGLEEKQSKISIGTLVKY